MRIRIPLLLLPFLAAATLRAQEQATTLATLAARADRIVVATPLAASDPSPEFHRVEFRTDATLKGNPGAGFAVLEPAGRCCGRALQTVLPGQAVLMFLQQRGAAVHPLGGDRGVLPATPTLLAHVQALLAATSPDATAAALAAALDADDARIRGDAALALAAVPQAALSPAHRDSLLAAMERELQLGSSRLPALVDASVRYVGAAAVTPLVGAFVRATSEDRAAAVRHGLLQLPAADVSAALAGTTLPDATAQQRACELAAARPNAADLPLLQRLLAGPPRVALAAAEAMVANGVPESEIALRSPKAVLEALRQRRDTAPGFRTLPTKPSR